MVCAMSTTDQLALVTAVGGASKRRLDAAVEDFTAGLSSWRLSRMLAWQDIKQRYRRSTLGPLWLTFSSAIQIVIMGTLSSLLFNLPVSRSMPYVCAGVLLWNFLTQTINEGATLFIGMSRYITQLKIPYSMFISQVLWRNVIILAHNAATYVGVAIYFGVTPSLGVIFWPLSFVLVLACLSWIVVVCAIVSVRYRDVPLLVQNFFNILFWLTPLMYFPEQLGDRQYISELNPVTHIVALLREPLLGGWPAASDVAIVAAIAIAGWIVAFLFFARYRSRIVYWL